MSVVGAPKESNVSEARRIAVETLEAVYRRGGFAAAELDKACAQRVNSSTADRALATELVYGVLRTRGALEARLREHAKRGLAGNDQRVVLHMLLAVYQLAFLSRVPTYAAISEAVSAVRELRGAKVAGFCNAVLRRLSERPHPKLEEAIAQSVPVWLRAALEETVGPARTLGLLGAGPATGDERAWSPTPTMRLRAGQPAPAWLEGASPGTLVPQAHRIRGAGDLRRKKEHELGQFVVQDEGSMFGALALGTRAGERVLDCCAGRGQKASLLAEQLGSNGTLWVTDKTERKLDALQREFQRLGLPQPTAKVVDWQHAQPDVPRDFDRVLVDAPCTGSGTLRRRPEIALRLTPEDVPRLATLAESILRNAANHVRPGGRVLFVVCSVLSREGEAVIERVSDVLRPTLFDWDHPVLTGLTHIRLLPDVHGTDGFFIASLAPI